jgi:hypothetical protein
VFLSKKVFVVLWLFLFKGGEVLEEFWGFLDKTGLTSLPNQPDQFPLPVERLSPRESV